MPMNWPLMENNITDDDLDVLVDFIKQKPILTQSVNVREFEKEWSEWLGVKYSVFVNSGSSANLITAAALKATRGTGEIIVSPMGWVSTIASVMQNDFTPVFVDIDPKTLSMDNDKIIEKITDKTKAVFVTHVQGFNGISDKLLKVLEEKNIALLEDVCESHGATHNCQKLGSFGLISNFSFYYAHHMSTIEGGMVCTNDEKIYQILRMYRSHGMVRESNDDSFKQEYYDQYPELNPEFIFAYPAYNVRSSEIHAVMGRHQLKRLDENNKKRQKNFELFLSSLDRNKYRTDLDFDLEGSCNYALNLVLQKADPDFCARVMKVLKEQNIEFRRGSAGGGNQLRQPYLQSVLPADEYKNYPEVDHIHFYGFYIGNYPDLPHDRIRELCDLLNSID
ncbi:CDP-4-keto-6-deoxy-D-glucose-3-dehydrase [Marinomonas sp. CT5]|uniref:DegT/DnrJ/EryC1/StrS family aminotransferase n=1 Tax=Marinomonas sp. CT5 TaxID=2066133 RepID=UPI001BAF00F1|nr:DegT/DnrJ/EryC1/StrS aminotransferase family protein [Marinomonas sp. CT5]QUX97728.1 CDP-4-keto-6-deoxy-D-glucose-3-dehydrase [Marinomonas sp. CT5]